MFQLNSKFKIILPIVIFAVLAILITVILIFITKDKNDKEKNIDTYDKIIEKDIYGITSLTEKYIINDLDIEYCDGNTISKINGLKNKEVEAKINEKIGKCKYHGREVIGNTISLEAYDINSSNTISYLNLRLDTGEEYSFEELFLAEASIEQIISQAVNYYYSCKYGSNYSKCTRLYDYDLEDFAKKPADFDLEEEVFRIINLYKDEGVKSFSIGNTIIDFQIGELELFLPTESIWQYLAIYKRFLTKESLFIKESKLTNYVLSTYRGDEYNGFILDNLFLEEYNFNDEDIPDKVMAAIKSQNEKTKSEIKEIAKKDKNNIYFLYVNQHLYEYGQDYGNVTTISLSKINKKDYELLGGEEFLAAEQRLNYMDDPFYFDEDYVISVDIEDIVSTIYKVVDANGKELNNYCYTSESYIDWYKKGSIVEIWNFTPDNYLVEEDCSLTLQQ